METKAIAIKEVFDYIQKFIDGKIDPLDFSYDLQYLLCEKCKAMDEENPEICQMLHDYFPEICDEYEMGDDPAPFIAKIKKEFERIKAAI